MSKRIFTPEQIQQLLRNEYVAKCSNKSITYSKDFKMRAVTLYGQGLTPTEIFRQSAFNINVIGRAQPDECLRRWKIIFQKKGLKGLSEVRGKNTGVRPKAKTLNEADKIKWLETEVAYLKAENDFLAKLRAKRRE